MVGEGNESDEFGDRDDESEEDGEKDCDQESPLKEFSDGGSQI
jgi:hypothetical protein